MEKWRFHAQAHIQDLSLPEDNLVFCHGLLKSLYGRLCQFPAGSRQQAYKFVAPVADTGIGSPELVSENMGDFDQNPITDPVPPAVVHNP